jgi:hypothetical protein
MCCLRLKRRNRSKQKAETILALKPVTFRYKQELDPDGTQQFGLIAEQVEKADLVVRDEDGNINTVRYKAANAMQLNEFLKEHRQVEEQGVTIAEMKKQIEALNATVQKVNIKFRSVNRRHNLPRTVSHTLFSVGLLRRRTFRLAVASRRVALRELAKYKLIYPALGGK